MKFTRLILLIILAQPIFSFAQTKGGYNKALADSLNADEYGMKMYQFVILKTGATVINNKDSVQQLFAGHMKNINRLVDAGMLIVAGPFGKNDKQYRGLFIFKAKGVEECKQLLYTDPAIKAGLLAFEITEWYGSAALPMYLQYADAVTQKGF